MRLINSHLWVIVIMAWLLSASMGFAASVQHALDLYQQRRYDEAAQAFQQAEAQRGVTGSQRVNMLYYRADALYRSGQTQRAATVYRQVVRMAPYSQAGHYSTIALQRMEKLGQAVPVLAKKPVAVKPITADAPEKMATDNSVKKPEAMIAKVTKVTAKPVKVAQPGVTKSHDTRVAQAPDKKTDLTLATKDKSPKAMVATIPDKKTETMAKSSVKPTGKTLVKGNTPPESQKPAATVAAKSSPSEDSSAKKKDWALISSPSQKNPSKSPLATKPPETSKNPVTQKTTPTPDTNDTYLSLIDYAGMRVHWAQQPITYFIDRSPKGMKSFSPTFVAQTERAFKQWQAATKNLVQLTTAPSADQARIVVRWSNQVDAKGQATEQGTRYTAGYTIPLITSNQLRRMEIRLSTLTIEGKPVTDMYSTALHEVGHSLGLMGHSDKADDVMYPTHNTQGRLTARDLRTILALYQQPAQISELPYKKPDTLEQAAVDARRQNNLNQLEAQVKKDPSLTLLNQLADLYRREAEASKTEKAEWYQKSLNVLNDCEKRFPSDGLTQLNKAVIASQLKNWPVADAAILKASQRMPDNAEVFITFAEIKRAQKQYSEARNVLATFERLASRMELDTARYRGLKRSLDVAAQSPTVKSTSQVLTTPAANAKAVPTAATTGNITANKPTVMANPVTSQEPIAFPALSTDPPIPNTQDAQLDVLPLPDVKPGSTAKE